MASEKRDFTDFRAFPGKYSSAKRIYEFPLLKHTDGAGRTRQWQISVRLVKDNARQTGIDWNLLTESAVPIVEDYFDSADLPPGTVAQAWTESGVVGGKITRTAPTYFSDVAFAGQSNQRNQFQQALIWARAQHLKRAERGGVADVKPNKALANTATQSASTATQSATKTATPKPKATPKTKTVNVMYFPMLARTWDKGSKTLEYPLYVQPKLDGVRCLVYIPKKNCGASSVVVYSRTQKEFPAVDYIKEAVYPVLNELFDTGRPAQSLYLDGELYNHGQKLQDISGRSRGTAGDQTNQRNQYHVYDCFYPRELNTAYESRKDQLEEFFRVLNASTTRSADQLLPSDIIKPVPTYQVQNEAELRAKYREFVAGRYEGLIARNTNGAYLADPKRTGNFMRSPDLVKLKQLHSDEFEVVGFTEGKRGKDKGAVIWICKTTAGHRFNVTPKNITYEERYKVFQECQQSFDTKYAGRMLTVDYEDLSKTGVPQRAKALVFRDYE